MAAHENETELLDSLNRIPQAAEAIPMNSRDKVASWKIVGEGEERRAELELISFQEQQKILLAMIEGGVFALPKGLSKPIIVIPAEEFPSVHKEDVARIAERLKHSVDINKAVGTLNFITAGSGLEPIGGKAPQWVPNAGLGGTNEEHARIYLMPKDQKSLHAVLISAGITVDMMHKGPACMLVLPSRNFYELTDETVGKAHAALLQGAKPAEPQAGTGNALGGIPRKPKPFQPN